MRFGQEVESHIAANGDIKWRQIILIVSFFVCFPIHLEFRKCTAQGSIDVI